MDKILTPIKRYSLGGVAAIALLVSACQEKAYTPGSYDDTLDDLVMGVYFGMDKDAFFKHCWDMNQEGQTHHGTIANMVMYIDSLNFDPKAVVNFYPKFENDAIAELQMIFYYHAWSPWNKKELPQDKLLLEVIDFFENKYDVDFEEKIADTGKVIYFKFTGPLLVRVYKDTDEMLVKADIINAAYKTIE